jgi:catechol 2,3-dioxygenase-like lactoylglutathione lyase family enzyme
MFSHTMVGSNDLERSRNFYDSLFTAIGSKPGRVDEHGRLSYARGGAAFMVTPPIDGAPATHGNGATIGFALDSPEQIRAWHEAGIAAGGTSIEDPPGLRQGSFGQLYLAYLRDPDGNKLCGLYRVPKE